MQKLNQEQAPNLVKERVNQAHKEGALQVYQDLLRTIWSRIIPTLGRATAMAIVERTLALTGETYPVLGHLRVTCEGVSFDDLRRQMSEAEREVLRSALKEFIADLIDVLSMLTGDILVQHLIEEIEGKKPLTD